MATGGVEIGSERVEIERFVGDSVGTINDDSDVARARHRHDGSHRHGDRGGRGDVADDEPTGARGDGGIEAIENGLRIGDRQRDIRLDDSSSGSLAGSIPDAADGSVFMIVEQDFVATLERNAIGDRVHAIGSILDESQIARRGSDEAGKSFAGGKPGGFPLAYIELHRLVIQSINPGSSSLTNDSGGRSEGAVIEISGSRGEDPLSAEGLEIS